VIGNWVSWKMDKSYRNIYIISVSMISIILMLVLNTSNKSFGEEQEVLDIPQAKSVYDTETMHLPKSVGFFIILIANEAHEEWPKEKHKHITDHNPDYVPTHVVIPKGTAVLFLNADAPWDTPHPHTINVKDSSGNVIYTTGKMNYSDASELKILPVGKYSIVDTIYDWMKGSISVTDESSSGNEVVGGFYSPTQQVSNNLDNDGIMHPGWLGYYESEFPKNGFNILSKYNFTYNTCSYCKGKYWPDNKTGNHTLIIFGTNQPLSEAIVKLQKLVKDNVYI
jgi:hypothetical protein